MTILDVTTKAKASTNAAKFAINNPAILRRGVQVSRPAARLGIKASKPVAKRRMRRRAEQFSEAAKVIGETLVTYGPPAAYGLGLAEPPKPKRTAPRVAAGVVIGASAVYFLEPEHGKEHREKVAQLVG